MIKYAVLRVVKPNIQAGMAQLEVLCRVNSTNITYWKSTASGMRNNWVLVSTRDEALRKGQGELIIPYAIKVEEE